MTTTTKTVIAIIVLVALGLMALFAYQSGRMDEAANEVLLPSGADTSDAGLAEDTAAIDASLSELESDQAEVDAGVAGHVQP